MSRKAHRVGRYSRGTALVHLDGRTREGRFARAVQSELVEHVGGSPSAPQQLLIRLASLKALRLALMTQHVLTDQSISERDDQQFLSWANSLRRDLDVLGIARAPERLPRLAEVLASTGEAA